MFSTFLKIKILIIIFTLNLAFAQNHFPKKPIQALPIKIRELPAPHNSKMYFPQLPQINGFPKLYLTTHMGPRCGKITKVESYSDETLNPSTNLMSFATQHNLDFKLIKCWYGSQVTPPSNSRTVAAATYLFAVFNEDTLPVTILLAASFESDYRRIVDSQRVVGSIKTYTIQEGNWEKVSDKVYSFNQTLDLHSESKELLGELGAPNREWETTGYKFSHRNTFQLFSINNSEVTQLIHTLPLAEYEWSAEDSPLNLNNQLDVNLNNYPDTIEVIQIKETITGNQQQWLGTFNFE